MSFLDDISFGFGAKLPLILQTEATECGLACLGMVAGFYGYRTDLTTLRSRFSISLKGATLANLIQVANRLELGTRAVKLELDAVDQLKLPCIVHWDFNHFVVLKEVSAKTVTIHDPAFGVRKLGLDEFSKSFTGVALELWPNDGFSQKEEKQPIGVRSLMGKVRGIGRSFSQIIILAVALEVFALVSPFFMQWVIDDVIVSADRDLLSTLAIGFGLLMLMQQAVSVIRSWVIIYMGTTLNIQWRANVFTHLIRLPIQYFEKRHLGDVLSRFGSIDQIQRTLTTSFLEAILDGVMTIVTLVMMFIYNATLGWIAVAAMALYGLSRWVWYRPLRTATEAQIIHAAKQQSHFLETVRGVKTIKLFQRHDERRSTWLTLVVDQVNADLHTQKLQLFYRLLNGLLFGIENILIIWLGAKLVMDGNFSVGVLMAFNSYKGQFDTRVGSLIDKFFEVKMLQLQAERLADIVLTEPELLQDPLQAMHNESALDPTIEVVGLRYRYAEQEPFVLDGVDLKIAAGESVAIVGPSGCGKTTLMNVLLGILPPTEGEVLIGGVNVKHAGINSLRKLVGTVLQDDVLFAGSIAENISFFDTHVDQEWVEECARMAAIAEEIDAMPMRYTTLVGDMGTVLSGGQKQRVLLARALYKRPKILFLDEATSHLDVAKEMEVNAAVKSLRITRVIIAHRPETIATASRVITMAGGKIAHEKSASAAITQPEPEKKAPIQLIHAKETAPRVQLEALAQPLKHLPFDSEEDDDLAAFGEAIGNARMVILGQQAFGEGNALALKSRIVRYLHRKKGFKVLAIGSGAFDVECIGEAVDKGATYAAEARGALFYMLAQAREMSDLFDYLDTERHRADGLRLVGFDWQHTGRFSTGHLCERLKQYLVSHAPQLFDDADWETFQRITREAAGMQTAALTDVDTQARYFERLHAIQEALSTQPETTPLLSSPGFWRQVLNVLESQMCRHFKISDNSHAASPAQSLAEQLLWLANAPFRDEKIIVWSTNENTLRYPQAPTMGSILAAGIGQGLIAVGFTGSQGHIANMKTGEAMPIAPPFPDSLEAKLESGESDCSFVDLRRPAVAEALMDASSWRFTNYQAVNQPLIGSYDLLVYLRTIEPSTKGVLKAEGASIDGAGRAMQEVA